MLLELGRLLRSARNDEVIFTHLSLLYYLVGYDSNLMCAIAKCVKNPLGFSCL
jgi:hypothetical protein